MRLTEVDLRILRVVELDPQISVQELAKRVGISWVTAREHLARMRREGVLADPTAVFSPARLGLVRHVAIFGVEGEEQMQRLEEACDLHPYTHYRVRIYGPYAGIFAQFDVPPAGEEGLRRFFEGLRDLGLCREYREWRSSGYRRATVTELERFDPRTNRWRYDWDKWRRDIERADSSLPPPPAGVVPFTPVDLQILRELTVNAAVRQTELRRKLYLTRSTASRKVRFVLENFVDSVRARIDRSLFDVVATKLFFCSEADPAARARLYNAFSAPSAPPFPLSIDLLEGGGVLLWGRMPPSHEHSLFYTLWEYLPGLQVFTMDTVGDHSRLYWFYPDNYDQRRGEWRTSTEYVAEAPLRSLKHKLGLA